MHCPPFPSIAARTVCLDNIFIPPTQEPLWSYQRGSCRKQIPPLPLKIHRPFDTISKTASAKGREFHVQSQLETFLHAADAGSFNKAAAERYITPTAVIKQINLLEESLGVKAL